MAAMSDGTSCSNVQLLKGNKAGKILRIIAILARGAERSVCVKDLWSYDN